MQTHLVPKIMDQNHAVNLRHFNYSKYSFIVEVPDPTSLWRVGKGSQAMIPNRKGFEVLFNNFARGSLRCQKLAISALKCSKVHTVELTMELFSIER